MLVTQTRHSARARRPTPPDSSPGPRGPWPRPARLQATSRDLETNPHASVPWEEAKLRLMAPFNLQEAGAVTQRRKGAKTQGFQFLGSPTRWVSDSSPSFPSHFPARCVLASWRLCVNCLSWAQAVNCWGWHPVADSAGEFGLETPVRSVSRIRERVAAGFSTASAALGWQGRAAFPVSCCQTGNEWLVPERAHALVALRCWVAGAGPSLRRARDERRPKPLATWRAWKDSPKGHEALSRYPSDKPPALPEVADWLGRTTAAASSEQVVGSQNPQQLVRVPPGDQNGPSIPIWPIRQDLLHRAAWAAPLGLNKNEFWAVTF